MRRGMAVVLAGALFVLTLYSLLLLVYDVFVGNFSVILDNVLLRSPNIYHMIVAPVRSIGTVIAFILFLPFLRLFLINYQVALSIFIIIEVAALLVIHITILFIVAIYLNRYIKNNESYV